MTNNRQPMGSTKKMPKPKLGPVTKTEKVLSKAVMKIWTPG
jgi:hypothetical protein